MEEYNGKFVDKEYITKDLVEATYLASCHFSYSTMRQGNIVMFRFAIFEGKEDLVVNLLSKFHNRRAQVDARTLLETFKSVKSSIYNTNYKQNYYGEHRGSCADEECGESDNE